MDRIAKSCVESNNFLMFCYIIHRLSSFQRLSIISKCVDRERISFIDYMLSNDIINIEDLLSLLVYLNKDELLDYYLSMYPTDNIDMTCIAVSALLFSTDKVVDIIFSYFHKFNTIDFYRIAANALYQNRLKYVEKLSKNGSIDYKKLQEYIRKNPNF